MPRLPSIDDLQRQAPQSNRGVASFDTTAVGAAVGQLGTVANEIDQRNQSAKAALTLAQLNNELHDLHQTTSQAIGDGSLDPSKAVETFRGRAAQLTTERLQGIAPRQREHIQGNILETTGSLERNLDGVVFKRGQSDMAATIDQMGEQAQRDATRIGPKWASEKYAAFVDFAGPGAGMTQATQEKLKQSFKEKATFSFYDAAGTAALTRGDISGITEALKSVQGPDGEAMDPLRRVQLTHQLFGYQQHLLAADQRERDRAAREQDVRETQAVGEFNKAVDLTLSGQYLSPDYIKSLAETTTGTKMQGPALALLASQQQVSGFAARSATARDAELNGLRAEGADPAKGTDPVAFKQLNAMEKLNGAIQQAVEKNPWEAAQQYGVIKDAPIINASSAADAVGIMQSRMKSIGQVENWVGHKVSPLQPQEAEQLSKLMRTLPTDQAATMLGSFGDTLGDSERIAHVAKQIGDKDGTMALAMVYANAKTTQGRTVAELVLRGDQALKDKQVLTDGAKATGWQAAIASAIGGAYSNLEAEEKTKRAAFLILAARNAEPDQGDTSVENAVRLATGGIIDFNGSKVPMPYGMTTDGQSSGEKRFVKAVTAIAPEQIAPQAPDGFVRAGAAQIPVDQFVKSLPGAQLVHAGQGLYNVRAGAGLVTNSAGRRITIQVKP